MINPANKETQTMTNNTPNNQTPNIKALPLSSENPVDSCLQALKQFMPDAFSELDINFDKQLYIA